MNTQPNSLTSGRGRGAAILSYILGFATALVAVSLYRGGLSALSGILWDKASAKEYVDMEEISRSLSIALPNGGCEVTHAPVSPVPIIPAWQASYPGSGARMTFYLIEALTGIKTNSDADPHQAGYEHVVAVKTHHPWNEMDQPGVVAGLDAGPMAASRAVVILRNPLHAIPSLFNFIYEIKNDLPNHSTRGTPEDWLQFRNSARHGVARQLVLFEEFVTYWMTKYQNRSDLLFISYEELTGERTGPGVAAAIAEFLGRQDGVDPIALESVPCVWETVVNYKSHVGVEETAGEGTIDFDPKSLRTGPKVRPYTKEMLEDMVATLGRVQARFWSDVDVSRIIASYTEEVLQTPIGEGRWQDGE